MQQPENSHPLPDSELQDDYSTDGIFLDEPVKKETTKMNNFTHRSGKSLLVLSDGAKSAASSRISKRTVSVRLVGAGVACLAAGSHTCCVSQDGVNVLTTDDAVVAIDTDDSNGLWARDGESAGDGVPDVMATVPLL
jgi:hypothetical protein